MKKENERIFLNISVPELRRAYNRAVKQGKEQFTYKDHDFVTSYAKYLLEYLSYAKAKKITAVKES